LDTSGGSPGDVGNRREKKKKTRQVAAERRGGKTKSTLRKVKTVRVPTSNSKKTTKSGGPTWGYIGRPIGGG